MTKDTSPIWAMVFPFIWHMDLPKLSIAHGNNKINNWLRYIMRTMFRTNQNNEMKNVTHNNMSERKGSNVKHLSLSAMI